MSSECIRIKDTICEAHHHSDHEQKVSRRFALPAKIKKLSWTTSTSDLKFGG